MISPRGDQGNVLLNAQAVVAGASEVIVEAVEVYDKESGFIDDTGSSAVIKVNEIQDDTLSFMEANAQNIKEGLLSGLSLEDDGTLHVRPGIEIRYQGSLSLPSDWDLTDWRYDGEPGTLSLRAGDDLNITCNLFDSTSTGSSSWRLNLAAGADLKSADPLAIIKGIGNLTIADNKAVYTKYAPISFASGHDTIIGHLGNGYSMFGSPDKIPFNMIPFNIASENNRIHGMVQGSLKITGGAIQTGTGDIQIDIGKDLVLISYYDTATNSDFLGSIRTLGEHPSDPASKSYWEYVNGGDISLDVGGSVGKHLNESAWDYAYGEEWSASYEKEKATQGLATMGGGDLRVTAGIDFYGQIGAFGIGDVTVFSGGDMYESVDLVPK